jgi:hypothetical protein
LCVERTRTHPHTHTHTADDRPQSASSVQACIYSFQFQYSFVVLNFGPALIERFSVEWVFAGLALAVLIPCVPLIVLMFRSVADYNASIKAPTKAS